jgi:hypothetical protein
MHKPLVGTYFYSWYNERRWEIEKIKNVPQIGYYASDDEAVIEWQLGHVKRSGCDFIAIQFMHQSDWGSQQTLKSIEATLTIAERHGLMVTFLLDVKVGPDNIVHSALVDQSQYYIEMMNVIHSNNWLRIVPKDNSGIPILFCFSPHAGEIIFLKNNFSNLKFLFPAYQPPYRWHDPFRTFDPNIDRLAYERHFPGILTQSLSVGGKRVGLFPFWSEDANSFASEGVVSVIPGYDDELLYRTNTVAPIIPRNGTNTIIDQIQVAHRNRADVIMIYSWNEYFEDTCIEPTLRYGDNMVNALSSALRLWTSENFIDDTNKLRTKNLSKAEIVRIKPDYDGMPGEIPKWLDQKYRLQLELVCAEIRHGSLAVVVSLTNVGTQDWSEVEQMALGARSIDTRSRAEIGDARICSIGNNIIKPGDSILLAGVLPLRDLMTEDQSFDLTIDVVWEYNFWFEEIGSTPIVIEVTNRPDQLSIQCRLTRKN